MIGTPNVNLADWARERFWELQVPLTLIMAPGDVGVTALSDFGERIHFPDQASIQFFLLGYRLGETHALDPQQASPFAAPTVAPQDEESLPGGSQGE
jgi:hypothetical protein